MTLVDLFIGLFGGLLAGFINTLAGNGSAITLTILTELFGLPGNVANATNRVGVVAQSFFSTAVFYNEKKIQVKESRLVITLVLFGSFVGLYLALTMSNESFKEVFKYLLFVLLIFILIKPKNWIESKKLRTKVPSWLLVPVYFLLGVYGGFIQMGMGVWFLLVMVMLAKMNLVHANALKSFMVMLYTGILLVVFHFRGLVSWDVGLILAIGQSIGGLLTARLASRYRFANELAYWVLVVSILGAIVKVFFFN